MQVIKGKYNYANIMIDSMDETTHAQIQNMVNHPAFGNSYIAIMPDCHAGAGTVVGLTMKMNDYIIPNVIGVDIGCGMTMAKFKPSKIDLPKIDALIKNNIPSGFSINSETSASLSLQREVKTVCHMIGFDSEKALKAIGSLGGGNHFIEIGVDIDMNIVVTIHSGSRAFGLKVASYYQDKAVDNFKRYFINDPTYKGLEFLLADSDYGIDYLHCMSVAQRFASANRSEMMKRIAKILEATPIDELESIHNFIADDDIIRKGATSAKVDERLIIPFNMADGIAICKGKGSSKYNNSAPHGAGRILSRTQAKKTLDVYSFKEQMIDRKIYTTTATEDTVDEAPGAYKPMDIILENIKDTCDVIELIQPIYNFKAGSKNE